MQSESPPSRIPMHIKVEGGAPLATSIEIPQNRTSHEGKSSGASVHVKVEEDAASPAASLEKPRRYPSFLAFTDKWSQSPLCVSTSLAEEFYRSTIVKRESEEALVSEDEKPLLCHGCERSVGLSDTKLTAEAPHDSLSPEPVSDIKAEASPPSPGYYIPTGAYKAKTTAPPASSRISHQISSTTNHSRIYHEARIPGRGTATPPSASRPNTELSYLLPVTPTPFSTPNAPVNPYNRPAHLHCIPGSLLEGMQRRTRWGNRAIRDNKDDKERRARRAKQEQRAKPHKKAKQDKQAKQAVPVPESRFARPAQDVTDNEHKISSNVPQDTIHGKTCAWYKIPFCRCCACIMVVGTKLLRNMFVPSLVAVPRAHRTTSMIPTPKGWARRRKWWRLQKCKQRDVETMMDDESHAVMRNAFYSPGRVVGVREV